MNRRDYEYDIPWIFIMKDFIKKGKFLARDILFVLEKVRTCYDRVRTGSTDRPKWVHHKQTTKNSISIKTLMKG